MKLFLTLIAMAGLFSGCVSTTVPSFNAMLEAAYSVDDGLIVTGDQLLQAKVITPAQANRLLNIADQMKGALDASDIIYKQGNVDLAMRELNAASRALSTAQSCANASNAGLTLDACLTGVPK